jgi:predicted nuclease of predicted toxin-antitoxin system
MPSLRFLADESCDFNVVRVLRAADYDVFAVSEVITRSVDRELIEQAHREQRILITEDKDFGWLVFVSASDSAGVILVRFPGNARDRLPQMIANLVQEQGEQLRNTFTVVQPGYIRIRQKPRL